MGCPSAGAGLCRSWNSSKAQGLSARVKAGKLPRNAVSGASAAWRSGLFPEGDASPDLTEDISGWLRTPHTNNTLHTSVVTPGTRPWPGPSTTPTWPGQAPAGDMSASD